MAHKDCGLWQVYASAALLAVKTSCQYSIETEEADYYTNVYLTVKDKRKELLYHVLLVKSVCCVNFGCSDDVILGRLRRFYLRFTNKRLRRKS